MNVLIGILLLWCIVGIAGSSLYLDILDDITKKYKGVIVTFLFGPVMWFGWFIYLIIVILGKFRKWLVS